MLFFPFLLCLLYGLCSYGLCLRSFTFCHASFHCGPYLIPSLAVNHSIAAHTSFRLGLCIIPSQPIPHSVSGCASFHCSPYLIPSPAVHHSIAAHTSFRLWLCIIPSQGMYSVMSQSILTALWRFLPFFMRFRSIWYPTNSSCEPLPMLMPLV